MRKALCNYKSVAAALCLLGSSVVYTGCSKDKSGGSGDGTATTTIKLTDAPIDDAAVSGAFVTISDIKLDGQSVQGFTKTTVDLNAYQNGLTKTIGTFSLAARSYNSITFVLDFDADASGNAPGCYILSTGAVKHKLQSTANTITINKTMTLMAGTSSSIVADFDLRKMIIHQSGADHYDFATAAELATSVRVVAESSSGTISGKLTDAVSGSSKVVAYAYAKGTFNRATEMQGQGASNIQFKNAVTSAVVNNSTGGYELHFLENGSYEIYFASYKDNNADGELELNGTLVVTSSADLLNLILSANASLTVNATATAVLP